MSTNQEFINVEVSVETTIIFHGDYITDCTLKVPINIKAKLFVQKFCDMYELKPENFKLYAGEVDWDHFSKKRIVRDQEHVKCFLLNDSISIIEKK
jgi:hypothetical protein